MTEDPDEKAMSFWEHLDELRVRIVKMAVTFAIGSAVAWTFKEQLLLWLTRPFVDAWATGGTGGTAALHFPAPHSLFVAYLKLSLLGGLIVSFPVMLYQLWSFVAPGLYSREKRFAIPFVVTSTALFAGGGYFGWRVAFPIAFQYLLSFSGPVGTEGFAVQPTVMIEDYIEFITRLLIAFGAVFELPVLVFFLSVAGIVTHQQLIRFSRYFIVLAFAVGAVLTPPDILSQFLLAVPLCVLYAVSIGIAWIVDKRRQTPAASAESAE